MKLTPVASTRISTCPGPGTGNGQIDQLKNFWPAGFVNLDSFHIRVSMNLEGGMGQGDSTGEEPMLARREIVARQMQDPMPARWLEQVLSLYPCPCSLLLEVVFLALGQQALLVGGDKAHQAIDGVGGRMLAGVVVAHLQFAEQADGEQSECRRRSAPNR